MRLLARGLAVVLVLSAASPALAFRGEPEHRSDARRFGLDRPEPAVRRRSAARTPQAVVRLDQLKAGGAKVRYAASGSVAAVLGPMAVRGGPPEAAARAFLDDYREALGIEPRDLRLESLRETPVGWHLLFAQTHRGVPVDLARVKFTVSKGGVLLALHSSHQPDITASPVPAVARGDAAAAVGRDLGAPAPNGGQLVYLPVYKTGEVRLAWKFKVGGPRAAWRYYVDAETGEVLLRYNDLRFACAGPTSGLVKGEVFDIDPVSTPGPTEREIANQKVWVYRTDASSHVVTGGDGSYCYGNSSKIFTALQGPYVNVAHFTKTAAHYDNGRGRWFTAATPVSSPSPYPNGGRFPNDVVYAVDVNGKSHPSPPSGYTNVAVKAIANFDFFQVGQQTSLGEIADDDEVHVYNREGERVASYLGSRGPFKSAAVHGFLDPSLVAMRFELRANEGGQSLGFRVNISSYLVLENPQSAAPGSFVWRATMTADGTRDEINVFYQLNRMHDYFIGDVNRSSMVWISSPVVAMTHFGPELANAFFNPDHDNLAFGDYGGGIALDATVVRHEYVHYVIDKIFPTINFGQHGAISEAVADYFAASSLDVSSIGKYVAAEGALRELECDPDATPACKRFPDHWRGEIHDDSVPLSQALWEVRGDLISSALGDAAGKACADGLVFNSLFFFPDSFQEFYDAMLVVDTLDPLSVPSCGSRNAAGDTIRTRFSGHMSLNLTGAYEPNDGTQSAADISTASVVTAALFPGADLDYYAFPAGPGLIRARLALPAATEASYYAYGMLLLDNQLRVLREVYADPDVNHTLLGFCPNLDCQTSHSEVTLEYENASGSQFYVLVTAGQTDEYSNSLTNSPSPYSLTVEKPLPASLAGAIVTAKLDDDEVRFTVSVSSWARQNFQYAYAQLRDHAGNVIPNTRTDQAGGYLANSGVIGSVDGRITGAVRLQTPAGANGFSGRFPAVGNVYLEVFAFNRLQLAKDTDDDPVDTIGTAQSMGWSPAIHLTAAAPKLTAYNNAFNPEAGQKATFKYETVVPGRVRLRLFNRAGSLVATLVDGELPAGKGAVDWAGRNNNGKVVASGIYLLRLEGPGGTVALQRVVVAK
ncbi:MAG: hypothetical protein HY554_17830 [Elusimicrobia bacterium]|nr:hypothetical protein [Elusimicrobiota bacterium]